MKKITPGQFRPKHYIFEINFPGELEAGLPAYSDTVVVTVASGSIGELEAEFIGDMITLLKEQYDGAQVKEVEER